uniref:glutathione S-transferase N-terminal domain-containing protein n=1 Tax=Pelagibacterium mangrovi TaxID=3119828 RepID=UPI002FCC7B36
MLDSPYVRRVAISMKIQNIEFEHEPLSVFSTFDAFAAVNPVVKAPSFVTDGGRLWRGSACFRGRASQD